VQTATKVEFHLVVEAVRTPVLIVERDADGLTKSIQLQTASSACIHDAGIVNNLNLDAHFACTRE